MLAMKKTIIYLFILLTASVSAFAQNDMKPLDNVEVFKQKMATEVQKVNSIESNFTQIKHISNATSDVISKGKFYYQKNDKVSFNYVTPMLYQIIINGSKMKMVSNGKENVYNVNSNGLMKEMKDIISACMTGNLQVLDKNYNTEYFQNGKEYLVKIIPIKGNIKTALDEITICLNKNDMSLTRMRMTEISTGKDKDYTEYQFSDKKLNISIPANYFSIK